MGHCLILFIFPTSVTRTSCSSTTTPLGFLVHTQLVTDGSHTRANFLNLPATGVLPKFVYEPTAIHSLQDLPLIVISVEWRTKRRRVSLKLSLNTFWNFQNKLPWSYHLYKVDSKWDCEKWKLGIVSQEDEKHFQVQYGKYREAVFWELGTCYVAKYIECMIVLIK